jgi:hypothetical protein
MITNLIQAIKTYWGYLMTIVAIGTTIFTFGVKSATKDITGKIQDARLETRLKNDSIERHFEKILNTEFRNLVAIHLKGISDTNRILFDRHTRMIISIDTLASKVAKTIPEYNRIMNGLKNMQFELVQPEPVRSVFPETKIHIMKKDSIK